MTQSNLESLHTPVLLERTLELLAPACEKPDAVLVDCTLGLGGHSEALLKEHPRLSVLGIDRDEAALELAKTRLGGFGSRVSYFHGEFDQLDLALDQFGFSAAQAILMDLGVSSMQIDSADRGFAYSFDAPLDMRMDRSNPVTAAQLLAQSTEAELTEIFRDFGEERFAKKIARAVLSSPQQIQTSSQLADLVSKNVPYIPGKSSGHPAKRVFQALRIAVNDELGILARALPKAIAALDLGGRLLVLSYHSLEDRLVKTAMVQAASSSAPLDFPVELPQHQPILKLLVKGAERASVLEISKNPRSASVRLRAAEKIRKVA